MLRGTVKRNLWMRLFEPKWYFCLYF